MSVCSNDALARRRSRRFDSGCQRHAGGPIALCGKPGMMAPHGVQLERDPRLVEGPRGGMALTEPGDSVIATNAIIPLPANRFRPTTRLQNDDALDRTLQCFLQIFKNEPLLAGRLGIAFRQAKEFLSNAKRPPLGRILMQIARCYVADAVPGSTGSAVPTRQRRPRARAGRKVHFDKLVRPRATRAASSDC